MIGSVVSNASSRTRVSEPERPKISCIATAPTKGGMISGSTPSVWISSAPRNWKRTVMYASGTAISEANSTLVLATYSEVPNDSRIRPVEKKVPKWPSVNEPAPSRNAATKTVPTGISSSARRKAVIAPSTRNDRHEAPSRRRRRSAVPIGDAASAPSVAATFLLGHGRGLLRELRRLRVAFAGLAVPALLQAGDLLRDRHFLLVRREHLQE